MFLYLPYIKKISGCSGKLPQMTSLKTDDLSENFLLHSLQVNNILYSAVNQHMSYSLQQNH